MPYKEQITCDVCGADLTTTGNSQDYYLALSSQRKRTVGNVVTDMWIEPPLEEPLYFCGWGCFDKWNDKRAGE